MRKIITTLVSIAALSMATSTFAKSTASSREYKRGFADCSAGKWDENQHGASYKAGCRAAEDKKGGAAAGGEQSSGEATSDAAPSVKPAKPAKISDLKGENSIKAIDIMSSRGFKDVDSISSGDTLYGVYFNPATGQCVQLTNAKNRVVDARDIGTHPNCK